MYISKVRLHNFRGFKGDHELRFTKGMNFLVGNNNCGKTSIFRAVEFTQSGKDGESYLTKGLNDDEYVSVELELTGEDLPGLVAAVDSLKKYESYIFNNEENCPCLRIMRSSEELQITQNSKPKTLSLKNVRVFNASVGQYENPTGIDSTISALFETQFVWADINIEDVADFSKAKICGRIINAIVNKSGENWAKFAEAHSRAFDDIQEQLLPIQSELRKKMNEQYGESEVKFSFSLPELADFLKFGTLSLSDNGIQTASVEKGTGMQRALALAIIQVYAEMESRIDDNNSKPLLFFLDEPETFMHPEAQTKLLRALDRLAENSQIFVATHSPFLLRNFNHDKHSLYVFRKENGVNIEQESDVLNLFGALSPTWGEINYSAFGVCSREFHDELYGYVQEIAAKDDVDNYKPKEFDKYLTSHGMLLNKRYIHLKLDGSTAEYNTTLATYVRNLIHHPENTHNNPFTNEELKQSTEELVKIAKDLTNKLE